jgi:uncharacterized repeat protein (TIGR01451 family)
MINDPSVPRPMPAAGGVLTVPVGVGVDPKGTKGETKGGSPALVVPTAKTAASVLIETIGPASVNVGAALQYEIIARNTTGGPVLNVRVDNEFPLGCQFVNADPRPEVRGNRLTWSLGTLEAGAELRFKVEVRPAGEGEFQTCSTVTFTAAGCLRTQIVQPRLVLKKSGPERVSVGDKAVFQLECTNAGTAPATGVVLHDQLPPGLQHDSGGTIEADLGTLAPQETKRVTLETKAIKAGAQVNRASVTATNAGPANAEVTVLVNEPALSVKKTGPDARFLNQEAEFTLEVVNPGNGPARNVTLTDTIPPGLTFDRASDNGAFAPDTNAVRWTFGTLNPGERRSVRVAIVAKSPGDFVNRAVAQGEPALEAKAEAPLHVEGVPALLLEVVDLDDPVEVGAETTYEIRVVNQGSCACQGLQIMATVPDGMEARGAEGPAPYRIQGRLVIFEPLARLAPRADALYRVKVFCKSAGDWRFKVQMTSDQLRLPVYEEESTRTYKD